MKLYMSTLEDKFVNNFIKKYSVCYDLKSISGILGEGNTYVETIDNAKLTIKKLQEEMITFEPMFIETEIIRKEKNYLNQC